MTAIDIFLDQIEFWHWFMFGGVLLLVEMIAPGAIFLWPGVAAIALGFIAFAFAPLAWQIAIPLWAALSVASIFAWRAYRKKNPVQISDSARTLNQRGTQYIGRRYTLDDPVINGAGNMRVGDTVWRVICDDDLIAGTTVEVIAVDGVALRIRATN